MDFTPGIQNTLYPQFQNLNHAQRKEESPKEAPSPNKKIPRPPNAFMMFAREYRPILLNKTPNVENKFISIKLGRIWKEMTAQQKAKYFYMAKLAEQRHRELYPDYRYTPKRKKAPEETIRHHFYFETKATSPADQGPFSLTRKLEAISRTVCDSKSATPVVYAKQPAGDGFNNQLCLTPGQSQQLRLECNDSNRQQGIITSTGAFQPVIPSAFQQYPGKQVPIYQDINGQPIVLNQVYCDPAAKGDAQQDASTPVAGQVIQQPVTPQQIFVDAAQASEQDKCNPPPLKKVHLRSMNDPDKTIEVLSETELGDGVYFVQSDTSQDQDKEYKGDETYVKVADRTYTDISHNTLQAEEGAKERRFDVLSQWMQFFQTVMPGERFMRDTLACPCLAFLACNEEFALKLGWKPGEVESFQNFMKSRLSSIVGEHGISGPCTSTPVKDDGQAKQEHEMAAPVTSSKDVINSDNSVSDCSSVYEDNSSNSMNGLSFSETSSSSTGDCNDTTDG